MTTNYEIGKTYDLSFKSVIQMSDGRQYLVATDGPHDYTIKPYDFQIEYDAIPHTLSCYVTKYTFSGLPCFEQVKETVLKERYTIGESHKFTVSEIHTDAKTNKDFYVLLDEFGITHRYYPKDTDAPKKNGDEITLIVKGFVPAKQGQNNGRLDLESRPASTGAVRVYPAVKPNYPRIPGKVNFGTEDAKKEFKSSIVYPAGETEPDIDKQLGIICRTIAGFMNANGGTLYIGVSDNGYVCGIEGDYSHLNDGKDEFTYKENDDQYMQKITNRICDALGRTAGTLIDMKIKEADGMKYCTIDIKKASSPVWFYGNKLFVRIVTTNRKLMGDEITQFVLNRLSKTAFAKQKEEEKPVIDEYSSEPAQTPAAAPTVSATPTPAPVPAAPATVKKAKKAWRNITFYNNGEWSFQKDELSGADVICNAEVPCDAKQNSLILILAYENGHVEATELKKVMYGKSGLLPSDNRRKQGLHLANGKLVSAFCVKKKDMLLLTTEKAGETFVKALDVDTLGIHDHMGKGNDIVHEKGAVLVDATLVPDDAGKRIALKGSGIFIEKNQKYTKGGVKFAHLASNYQDLVNSLKGIVPAKLVS